MASKSQKKKKATAAKSSTTQPRKTEGRTSSASNKSNASMQKQPIRREVWGGVLLVLALCLFVDYLKGDAILIDSFGKLLKGLMGYGYWVAAPALTYAGVVLLFHHGRPVRLRIACVLLLPMVFGMLSHMARSEIAVANVKVLWETGVAMSSGGVVAGVLSFVFVELLTKVVSVILFVLVFAGLLLAATSITPSMLVEWYRSRPRYEEEPEPERPVPVAIPVEKPRRAPEKNIHQYDIPLDDEPLAEFGKKPAPAPAPQKEKEGGRFTGFFRHKSEAQKTPDQVVAGKAEETPAVSEVAEEPPAQPPKPPVEAPMPIQEPASPRKEKMTTAKEVAAQTAAVTAEIEEKLAAEEETYQFPPITLLKNGGSGNIAETGAELRNNSRRLAETLASFGVDATPADVVHGPSVTRYEFVLDQGVKLAKITNLADDIALALGASGVRIAPIPDKISVVGIEVPNKRVTPVLIRDVIESRDFTEHRSKTAFSLGRDIGGRNVIGDIEKLPHVLIAGTTGSGKSVCTNSLIISLLYKSTPDEVRFIMVDPKMVELAPYNGIPHLLIPVVTDPKKAAGALQWAVFEMMKRYKTFSEHGVKKLEEFNRLARASEELETMPSVVVVIDELADLMLVAAKEVEESICRVAQMGRAAGVHLVIATQRPSADVITGLMKANIPSRIAFAVASSLESRIILDTTGAEKLVGRGDMLYAPLGAGKPQRVQGCYISPEEIEDVVQFVKQSGEARYSDEVIAKIEESIQEKDKGGARGESAGEAADTDGDELLPAAVDVVLEIGQASVSMLQRRLKLGYSRAARLVDQMEERGIVGPFEGSKPRQLLITRAQWQEMQMGTASGSDDAYPFPEGE